jgi:hypothetical protein
MANAAAPLSAVFDGQSPLEQLHCALLMRVMRAHGMGGLLDGTTANSGAGATSTSESRTRGKAVRRLLVDTVLATDMRVHEAFMERFRGLVGVGVGVGGPAGKEKEKEKGTESLVYRKTTLCQGIIKCADISNPVGVPFFPPSVHSVRPSSFHPDFLPIQSTLSYAHMC